VTESKEALHLKKAIDFKDPFSNKEEISSSKVQSMVDYD
jgi:hypothetical protein